MVRFGLGGEWALRRSSIKTSLYKWAGFSEQKTLTRAYGVCTIEARLKYTDSPPIKSKDKIVSLPVSWPSDASKSNKTGALASTPLMSLCFALGTSVKAVRRLNESVNKTMNSNIGGTRSDDAESFRGSVLITNKHNDIVPSSTIESFFCR